jgi:guanylate kinase
LLVSATKPKSVAGRLFVVSGPAGAGKGTILERVRSRRPDLALSVSATTRAPRAGEVDGVSYYFLDEAEFRRRIEEGAFLEWADVHGNLYGTLQSEVEAKLKTGSLILEIDPQGAMNVRDMMPDCVLLFIAPPSVEVLRERLLGRGSETPETLERRLADAVGEMATAVSYDAVVVNDDLDEAVEEFVATMARYEGEHAPETTR